MSFLKNPRMLILIACLLLSAFMIHPVFDDEGVAIRFVAKNSSASLAGIESPGSGTLPTSREIIQSIDKKPVVDEVAYAQYTSSLEVDDEIVIETNKRSYFLTVKPILETIFLNETERIEINETVFNETTNETVNITSYIEVPKTEQNVIGVQDLGLTVYNRPTNNIRKGLDLVGGTRVLLEPVSEVSSDELELIITNINQRLNVYGVGDISVRATKDFSGNTFISVELAGVNKDEVRELLSSQGKFEAKVGSETVFLGGDDITYVCRSAECSGLDPQRGCGQVSENEWSCSFYFSISLTPEAAQRQAEATKDLAVEFETGGGYLSENLSLYLDDVLVDQLRISDDLKGEAVTDIRITGGSSGTNLQEAQSNAIEEMKQMQTVLVSGSLPVRLEIVKTDAISPALGRTFLNNVILVGFLAIIAVVLVVFARYREWRISVPMVVTMVSEVVIILGIASLPGLGWQLDLAAIAGIIIAVGTGVDHQIVIASEISEKRSQSSWKDRIKNALFIIMAAYFTTVVAMIPLMSSGAGLLKGFALTTIIGVTIGVFITRPAYAVMVETLMRKKK